MNYNPAFNRVASFREIAHQVSNQSAEPASANQALDDVTAPVLAGARLIANVRVTRGAVDAEALAAELEQAAPGKVRRIKLPANPAELAAFVKKWEAANLAKRMGGAGMLILPLAACGGGGGGGGVFGGGDAGTSGFVIDGYVAGAAVSRVNGSGNTVYTEADGSFSGLTGHGPIKVDLSGATDIDRPGFVFPDGTVLTAPEGSTVVTPLTALMQTLIDGGKTLDEAQEMVATWAGVDPDTDLRSYDFVSAKDASAYVKAQQVLNIVSTAAAGDVMKAEDTLKALADLITDNQAANLGDSEVVRQALIDAGAGYTVANAIASQVRDHNKQLGDLLEELEEGNKTFDELQTDAKSVNESQGKNNADGQGLVLLGDDNANELVGTERNDKLIGGRGGDTLTGGEGEDTFVFTLGAEGVRIAFNAEREPVAGDVYSVKLGENGENYFQVEVEEGQSLQQVLSALVNEINKDADLEDVTAYREGDAIVVIGFGTDEAEAEVRGAGEAGEISNVFTIDFSGEGAVKEGQLYIINITGREEPIVYTAGAGDELADVIEGLKALIDDEEGLSADLGEGTITITASNRDYRVDSVSVKELAGEPADITAEAVGSIEIAEAHDSTVRIDVTNEQAATAGSFSITIGGKEIKLEGEALESVADGDGLAGAIADAIGAELGADNGVTVAWADGVLTITDSNSRFLSDASLKTAGADAEPTSVEISFENADFAHGAVTSFSITIKGLNDDEPIVIPLDVLDGDDLAETIEGMLRELDGEESEDIVVDWDGDGKTLTITDAAGREISDVSVVEFDNAIAAGEDVTVSSVDASTATIAFGTILPQSVKSFSITIEGVNNGEPIVLVEGLLDGDGILNGETLEGAILAALHLAYGEDSADIAVAWDEDAKTLTITDSEGRALSDVSVGYDEAEIHEITSLGEVNAEDITTLFFSIGEGAEAQDVTANIGEPAESWEEVAGKLQAQIEDEYITVVWDSENEKLVITDAKGRPISGVTLTADDEGLPQSVGSAQRVQEGGAEGTLDEASDAVEVENAGTTVTFDVTDEEAQGATTFLIRIAGLNDGELIRLSFNGFEDGNHLADVIQQKLRELDDDAEDITVSWKDGTLTIIDRQVRDITGVELRSVSEIAQDDIEITDGSLAVESVEIDGDIEIDNDSHAAPQVSVVTFGDVPPQIGYTYSLVVDGETYSVTVGEGPVGATFGSVLKGLWAVLEEDGYDVAYDAAARTLTITGKVEGTQAVPFEIEDVSVTTNTVLVDDAAVVDTVGDATTITFEGIQPLPGHTFAVTIEGETYSVTVDGKEVLASFASILESLKEAIEAGNNSLIESVEFNPATRTLTITGAEGQPVDIGDGDVVVTRLDLEDVDGALGDNPVTTTAGREAPEPEPQESVITFEDIEVQDGYTYTVTIEGKTYSVTAGEDDIEGLADVLNALKDAIEADADGEDGHGLSVEVTAQAGQEPGDGTYTLTITGREDGTPFTVGGVTVTEMADVDGALGASPVDTTAGKEVPMAQVSTVTFTGDDIAADDTYTVTINGADYSVTVGVNGIEDTFASVLGGLKDKIDEADLGFRVEVTDDNKLVITGLNDETFTIASNGPEGDTGSVDTDLVPGQWQVSTITFGDVAPEVGYTYKVTINGETYSVTVDGNSIEANLTSVLNGLKAAIDADSEDHGLIVNVTADTEPEDYGLTIIGKEDGTEFKIGTVSVTGDVPDAIHTPPGSGPNTSFMFAFNSGVPANDGYTYTVKIGNNTYSATVGELINGEPLENSLDAVVNRLQELVEDGEEGVFFDVGLGGENNIEVTVFFEPAASFTLDVSVTGPVFGALEDVETTYEDIAPVAQVSTVTFEEVQVEAGYTYTVTINGTAYDYTAVEGGDLGAVLNALKDAIDADAATHGLSVEVGEGEYTLTITGKDDGTPFVVNSVAVTELANVDVALGDNPIATTDGVYADDTQKAEVETTTPASEGVAQVDTVTFSGNVEEGDYFRITIGDHVFAYRAEAEDTLESVRDALIDLISGAAGLGVTAAAFTEGDDVALTLTALIPNEPFDATAEALNSAPQVSVVTFEDVPPEAGYVYFILIDGRLYSVIADGEEDLAAVLTGLKEEILGEDGHGLSVALLPPEGENGSYQLVITGRPDGTAFEVQHAAVVTLETETIAGAVGEEPVETVGGVDGVREQVEVTFADRELTEGDTYTIAVTVAGCLTTFTYLVMEEGITLADVLAALAADINETEDLEAEVVDGVLVIAGPEDGSHLDVTAGVTSQEYKDVDIMSLGEERIVDLSVLDLSTGEKILIAIGDDEFEEVFGSGDSADALALRLQAQIEEAETGVTVTVLDGRISFSYGGEGDAPEIGVSHVGLGDVVEDAIPDDNLTEVGLSDSIIDSMAHITDFVAGEDKIDIRDFVNSDTVVIGSLDRLDIAWSDADNSYTLNDDPLASSALVEILNEVLGGVGQNEAAFIVFEGGDFDGQTYLFVNDADAAVSDEDLIINMTGINFGTSGLTPEEYFVQPEGP